MDHPPIKYDNDSSSLLSYHAHTHSGSKITQSPAHFINIHDIKFNTHGYVLYRSSPKIIRPSLDAIRLTVVELLKFADVHL